MLLLTSSSFFFVSRHSLCVCFCGDHVRLYEESLRIAGLRFYRPHVLPATQPSVSEYRRDDLYRITSRSIAKYCVIITHNYKSSRCRAHRLIFDNEKETLNRVIRILILIRIGNTTRIIISSYLLCDATNVPSRKCIKETCKSDSMTIRIIPCPGSGF